MTPAHAPSRPPALVPAVARAVAVMDLLARERRPLTMAGVADALDLPKSSVHGLCNTLLSFGYLRRGDGGNLQIGPGVMNLAEAFVASTSVAAEFDALWRDAGVPDETLVLSVLSGADVVYVGVRHSARPLGLSFSIGMRLPADRAATGKAMLAFLEPAQRAAIVGGPSRRATALRHELALTRERGYAVDDEGVRAGVYSLAAPVFDAAGRPVAGVAVCINKAEMTAAQHERQRRVVVQVAQRLSRRLGARAGGA